MYALGKKTRYDEEIHPNDRGYSVYYYDSTKIGSYCVLQQEGGYNTQRILLNVASLTITIFFAIGVGATLMKYYSLIEKKLRESEYWKFLTWSILIISLLAICLILANNGYLLYKICHQYDSKSLEFVFMIVHSIICFGVWPVDAVCCIVAMRFLQISSRKYCCFAVTGSTIMVYFIQLMSFHVAYINLGATAAPSETLSVVCSFITVYIFAVIYFAVLVKYLTSRCDCIPNEWSSVCDNSCYRYCSRKIDSCCKHKCCNYIFCCLDKIDSCCKHKCCNYIFCCLDKIDSCCKHKCCNYIFCGLFVIAGTALIGGIAILTAFFYRLPIVMDISSQNEGLWGVIKFVLPALFVSLLGYCGNKILKYDNANQNPATELPSVADETGTNSETARLT